MEESSDYINARRQKLADTLLWLTDPSQLGVSEKEINDRLKLNNWEIKHLLAEFDLPQFTSIQQKLWGDFFPSSVKGGQTSIFDTLDSKQTPTLFQADVLFVDHAIDDGAILYSTYTSILGQVFIASHKEVIVQITFSDEEDGMLRLKKTFPKSILMEEAVECHNDVVDLLNAQKVKTAIQLLALGSAFQQRVWSELIQIQSGERFTYLELALKLNDPNGARAVGTAVGANPYAILVPCHRIVHQTGKIGPFRWGSKRKRLILALEK